MDSDRNLLFGIAALQLEYIDVGSFTEACAAWSVARHKSLATILVEHGWMDAHAAEEVERLVERKLSSHGGDARKVLVSEATHDIHREPPNTAPAPGSEVTASLSQPIHGAADRVDTELYSPAKPQADGYAQMETVNYSQAEERSRYSLTKMHGEGGLGRVWQALDLRLNRHVALKEIRPDKLQSPLDLKRFSKEAQITSQLEHPNIVPVYELSRDTTDSRVFYTMRFVRGDTFRNAIDAYHRKRRAGTATTLELRALLEAFLAICNALGFAHARGVLHRDLKPSNVMVGAFGEVIVLDWGLAKMIDQPADEVDDHLLSGGPISVTGDAEIDATQQGSILGTLPYMAPEQAAGRLDLIDVRTDVYGLGAILFAILTGNHPHQGSTTQEVRFHILNEPTPHARALDARIDPALDAICAKAMAKQRPDRYGKVCELADDIRCWLADEPVSAYHEPWSTRCGRWLRQHRTWAQAIATTTVIVTLVAIAAVVVVERARRNERLAKQRAEQALIAEQQANTVAAQRLDQARHAIDTMMTGVSDVLAYFPGMQALREELLQQAVERYEQYAAEVPTDPELQVEAARAVLRLGDVFRGLGKRELAEQAYRTAATRLNQQLDVAPSLLNARFQLANAYTKLGSLQLEASDLYAAGQFFDAALGEYASLLAASQDPNYLHAQAGTLVNQALLLSRRNAGEESLRVLSEAVAQFRDLAQRHDDPRFRAGLAMARLNVGNVLIKLGRNSEAIEPIDEAVTIYTELAEMHPDHPPYLEELATTRLNLAAAQRTRGLDQQERRSYELAVQDFELLIDSRPDVPLYRERLALAAIDLAAVRYAVGDNREAQAWVERGIAETEALLKTQPPLAGYHEQWALGQATLGRVLSDLGQDEMGVLHLQSALEKYEALIAEDPEFAAPYQMQLAACRSALGVLYGKMDEPDIARTTLLAAADAFTSLLDTDPTHAAYLNGLAWTYAYLADSYSEADEKQKARDYFERAIDLREELPAEPEYLHAFARLLVQGQDSTLTDGARAVELALQATRQAPSNPRYAATLGSAYFRAGELDQAIETLRAVDQLEPRGGTTHDFWLALALRARNQTGDADAARNRYEQAKSRMLLDAPGRLELVRLNFAVLTALEANAD